MARIIYTHTDESPMLATASFLPIVKAFASQAGVAVEERDISLSGRILAALSDYLPQSQRTSDALAELGELAKTPEANIIKLPNISASLPQLLAAIKELQAHGYDLPEYPSDPRTDEERDIRARYDAVKGSAVNPVLREGNSDRRAPQAVKNYAKAHPHRMGAWDPQSKTTVATMRHGDFRSNEKAVVIEKDDAVSIVHVDAAGNETVLRADIPVLAGEIFDSTKMEARALDAFLAEQVRFAKKQGVLFSAHLKATMMKVSDPVIFGHVVRAFFPETFAKYGEALEADGLLASNGLGSILEGISQLSQGNDIRASFEEEMVNGPALAMVNSDKGITSLHVPSDVIIDASMPAMIRNSGQMWGADGSPADTLAVIPDSTYAGVYDVVVEDCKKNGAFDPATMGTVPNVGLMAQKAEEYGSHDKTFVIDADGTVEVRLGNGHVVMTQSVKVGDIYRSCQAKDAPIHDWVQLAVRRARISGMPAVFWLDPERAHDRALRAKVEAYLADEDTNGLDIRIMSPAEAAQFSVDRIRRGEDTISVTGNVLRDYLTDLFPIMELGTSAKMLSVVPLMAGGGLFETGAGGSAPKHVQQLVEENYLRWDSLGEFLALAESLRQFARFTGNKQASVLADCLDRATERLLNENKSPSRRLGGIDNRGSHAWIAIWWADELVKQNDDAELAAAFAPFAGRLANAAHDIERELIEAQGTSVDIGGYYHPDRSKLAEVMRPSATLNEIISELDKN
ncbi:isocitrate dehydrogenase [Arcanobacterium pluranimalium]|uniref:NADP-dependent isocitrate dehydrogenase n=1 Tax=Arcanobacterium pluranimalium TaxID=108028 RepID=UPI00195B2299|nr:NADP-dependent isocitrate dehydrogenase [Arcanobacterium pluranimalium]MBM7824842.1 isocitrate dehydrogenase [Arcanobacterium pluranimalium]